MKIAVVGASNNPEKYGNRIVRHLLNDGHTVFPVNLREKIIFGLPAYARVADIESPIDIVDIVLPPEKTLAVLKQLRRVNKFDVWIQPGAESDEVIGFLQANAKDFGRATYNMCIMTSLDRIYG